MIRNIRAFGAALIAVAAMGMATSSAVQASELHFTTSENNTVITGQQITQLVLQVTAPQGIMTKCDTFTLEGTVSDEGQSSTQLTAKDLTLTPTYSECASWGVNSQVKMNGCKFVITGSHEGAPAKTAYLDLVGCTAGKQMEMLTPLCTISYPEQSTLGHVVFSNKGEGGSEDVEAQFTISGIKYQLAGAACSHTTNTLTSDATMTGSVTLRAYKDLGSEQVTLHGHQYEKRKDGAQLGVLAT